MRLRAYNNGWSMSSVQRHATKRGKRGECIGWTPGAARRNRDFLYSVDVTKLNPEGKLHGVALTLTTRDVPESSAELHRRIDRWMTRQRRRGLVRLHYVIEFTKRGVPHVHAAGWYDNFEVSAGAWGAAAIGDWIEIASASGTHVKAQHGAEIDGVAGWLAYLAKHAARGARHYQRRRALLPAGWQKAGRLWGHSGQWPTDKADVELIPDVAAWWLLRLTRSWLISQARRGRTRGCVHFGPDWKEVSRYRKLLRHGKGDPLSYGRFSMWMPRGTLELLLGAAMVCQVQGTELENDRGCVGRPRHTPETVAER